MEPDWSRLLVNSPKYASFEGLEFRSDQQPLLVQTPESLDLARKSGSGCRACDRDMRLFDFCR